MTLKKVYNINLKLALQQIKYLFKYTCYYGQIASDKSVFTKPIIIYVKLLKKRTVKRLRSI